MFLALTLVSSLLAAPADSIRGSWQITGDVAGSPLNEVCTITQTGKTLSGNCTGATGQPYPVTGQVKDSTVTFQHGGDYQGQELTIIYSGALSSPTSMKGTVAVKPFDVSGVFTAVPTPAAKK